MPMYITVLYSFYANTFHNTPTHQKMIQHLPPVNSGIVAQGCLKGPSQERSMWDESDSYALENTQARTPRKEMCVGSDQQYAITKQTQHFGSVSYKQERKK